MDGVPYLKQTTPLYYTDTRTTAVHNNMSYVYYSNRLSIQDCKVVCLSFTDRDRPVIMPDIVLDRGLVRDIGPDIR